jgi:hypothetical protein
VDAHSWIDICTAVGLVAATLGAVFVAHRLDKSQKLEDTVNEHSGRIKAIETAIDWIRTVFKQQ